VSRKGFGFVFSVCLLGFVSYFALVRPLEARGRWNELNIGPFYIETDGDTAAAREALNQLEQVRWVLGGLLESKDLPSTWPIRILLTNSEKTNPSSSERAFVSQNGQYLLIHPSGTRLPLGEIAGILLEANTPRLPLEVESGLRQLFGTLEAKGSRVTWGGPPPHPDLAWARMQLFATKFEYSSSFHIFITALKSSGLAAAERNAFGKDSASLEQEAAANLASRNWQPVPVSGRPLDPKRDFGEHSLDDTIAAVYSADATLAVNPKRAEAIYKSAIETEGIFRALGYEGLAALARLDRQNPKPFLDNAIRAGSRNAPVYADAADGLDRDQALPLLKKAAQLNPRWAEPVYRQALLEPNPVEKQALLKKATLLNPRATEYWIELAQLQTTQGQATAAQGSWLRAEDSAPTGSERDRVHQLRLGSEQERLDAADSARRREREAAHLEDERAQDAAAERIRAAERKANTSKDTAAGGEKPSDILSWDQVVPQEKLDGTLTKVDCLGSNGRLYIKDRSGSTVQLLLKNLSSAGLSCGAQQPTHRVSLTYAAQPDDRLQTSGNVVSIRLQ
jgi:hypothetical protein